jgi:transcriptional antiterminator NusG
MDETGGVGILPTQDELAKKATEKPVPAVVPTPTKGKKKRAASAAEPEPVQGNQVLVLKTQVGQERRVAEALGNKARRFKIPILSILSPAELRGFVFLETNNVIEAEKAIRGVSYARALLTRSEEVNDENGTILRDRRGKVVTRKVPVNVGYAEVQKFLTPVSAVSKIQEGNIVELVSGPFRGEKAKVTRVDDTREEITVELIESMVPIPITVKGENVRVLAASAPQ